MNPDRSRIARLEAPCFVSIHRVDRVECASEHDVEGGIAGLGVQAGSNVGAAELDDDLGQDASGFGVGSARGHQDGHRNVEGHGVTDGQSHRRAVAAAGSCPHERRSPHLLQQDGGQGARALASGVHEHEERAVVRRRSRHVRELGHRGGRSA